jgi:glutathione S-transferase
MKPRYTVYKSDISYFSGKLEAYLRYKGIAYEAIECGRDELEEIAHATGVKKMPAVKMDNGQWLFDTTPMLEWLEQQHPEPCTVPDDPALAFLALLIEDYGDEWLWRPAMWWRWVPRASRWAVGYAIGKAFAPRLLARPLGWFFGRRQQREWLWDDGVSRDNELVVRDMLFREFEFLESLLIRQPFLLGSHPSSADFGYFASMFRHFGNDPDPAEVMRQQAPNTYEWLARLWNTSADKLPEVIEWRWPKTPEWEPLLTRIATDYLPYLHQNALAFQRGHKRFDFTGHSLAFPGTKTTNYRAYCRERLQQQYQQLKGADHEKLEQLFRPVGGLGSLHKDGVIASGLADTFILPRQVQRRMPAFKLTRSQARN